MSSIFYKANVSTNNSLFAKGVTVSFHERKPKTQKLSLFYIAYHVNHIVDLL